MASEAVSKAGQAAINTLVESGRALDFAVEVEVPVPGGRIDVVWFLSDKGFPEVLGRLPAVAFEVESSWRTRKHIKGDYPNLFELGPSLGLILLLGVGEAVASTRRFARALVDRPGPRIAVWSAADLEALAHGGPMPVGQNESRAAGSYSAEYPGKYHRLWAWLRDQPGDRVATDFAEIEEIIGMRLPPSSRKHAAHWHSYDGSAVVRAIEDAGWQTRDLDLEGERVAFVRAQSPPRG